jgi:hypothetical protein
MNIVNMPRVPRPEFQREKQKPEMLVPFGGTRDSFVGINRLGRRIPRSIAAKLNLQRTATMHDLRSSNVRLANSTVWAAIQ